MRNLENVEIEEIILHIVAPREGLKVLSEVSIPSESDPRIFEYFRQHITKASADSQARPARFRDIASPTASLCQGLLTGAVGMVPGSQALAQNLYQILDSNRRFSSSALAICLFRATQQGVAIRSLALLKVDQTQAFRPVTTDQGRRTLVTLEIEEQVLPTAGERLQKCALIRSLSPRPDDYDLLLVDRQTRGVEGPEVAVYFTGQFLDAELALDSHEATRRLYKGLLSAKNDLQDRLDADQRTLLEDGIAGALGQSTLDLETWVEGLALPAENRAALLQKVEAELRVPLRSIEVDRQFVQKMTKKTRFQGDFDLLVEASTNVFDQLVVKKEKKRRGGRDLWEIVIWTEKWEEIP